MDNELLSGESLRQIFDASPSAMILVAVDGTVRLANRQACRLFGYERRELLGTSIERLVPERFRPGHPAQRAAYFAAPVARAMGEGRDLYGLRRDGSEVPIEIGLNPIHGAAGVFVLAAIIDISQRKRAEHMLRTSLREKETLLREIHHRVKNNMQVVSSLVSLQLGNVADERHRALFAECQTRVRTMALIHEKLYSSGNLSSLDGREYLGELAEVLFRSYRPDGTAIRLELHLTPLQLDIQIAIPVGLILHELVTNALKYAFVSTRSGTVAVSAGGEADGRCRLQVTDDGCGLPPDLDPVHSKGLGFRMLVNLVKQIDGQFTIDRERGTSVTVQFVNQHVAPALGVDSIAVPGE